MAYKQSNPISTKRILLSGHDKGSVHFYLNIFCCGFNQGENYLISNHKPTVLDRTEPLSMLSASTSQYP